MIKVGSDFSGVGSFDQALIRLGIEYKTIFACDWDKYARKTYALNYGEPDYFPSDVYDREIPKEPLDIYMSSPSCQSFSLAGKRLGENDPRGILFYNTHEFIATNNPRYFIIENVKGLLSDDGGKTFGKWIDLLGGKSVNGTPILFPADGAAPYHVYYQVMNAKDYGVPQNRERIFIIGIRDDADNSFQFPRTIPLTKKLGDLLEDVVDEKYYLSEKMVEYLNNSPRSIPFSDPNKKEISNCVLSNQYKMSTDQEYFKIGAIRGRNPDNPKSIESGIPTEQMLEVNEGGVSNVITTVQKDNVVVEIRKDEGIREFLDDCCGYIRTKNAGGDKYVIQLNPSLESGGKQPYQQNRIYDEEGLSPALLRDKSDIKTGTWRTHKDGLGFREMEDNNCPTIPARAREDGSGQPVITSNFRIRRLTPKEAMRLMDFNSDMIEMTVGSGLISDSQLYKQAGNSIVVSCLVELIKKLKL